MQKKKPIVSKLHSKEGYAYIKPGVSQHVPVSDPRHPAGGRRRRKAPPIALFALPSLRTLASDQIESVVLKKAKQKA